MAASTLYEDFHTKRYRLRAEVAGAAVSYVRQSRCCYEGGNTSPWGLCSSLRADEAFPHHDDIGPLSRAAVVVQEYTILRTVGLITCDLLQAYSRHQPRRQRYGLGIRMPVPDNDCKQLLQVKWLMCPPVGILTNDNFTHGSFDRLRWIEGPPAGVPRLHVVRSATLGRFAMVSALGNR
jgi:hypothetical protein